MLKVNRYLKDPKDRAVIPKDSLCVLILPNPYRQTIDSWGRGEGVGREVFRQVKTGKTDCLDMRAGFDAAQMIQ